MGVFQDAFDRAYNRDVEGAQADAIKLYRMGLNIVYEGLSLQVQSSGLGAGYSNVAKWRDDMNTWQQHVLSRLRDLESGGASTSARRPPQRIVSSKSSVPATRAVRAAPAQPAQTGSKQDGRSGAGLGGKEEARLREVIEGEVLDTRPSVRWKDVAGLSAAKQARPALHALQEMVILPAQRADLFQGLRAPARGLLLYGPPGNGKTLLAKALASEAQATFFNISASTLTSKWHGEAEKLARSTSLSPSTSLLSPLQCLLLHVRMLFRVAAEMQPAIIFIDEIDSILSERSAGEHEASRRLKTQFLIEFDGVANGSERIVVIGATNRPQELDDAVRRRLVKRIYIPMPDADARRELLKHLLRGQPVRLSRADMERVVTATSKYSASDLAALCREAAIIPIRELGQAVTTVSADQVRHMELRDFGEALQSIRPSVNQEQLHRFDQWTQEYGTHS
ncbi:AAA-domain-containing protein [Coccomyxa subellipsoidea C-169]|uniref:microtubule-severing ATPase n=1 Tax=Coccomyxa subellipsoidea (strain C-169) TaxID=574566 RepID=I0YWL5_COCSC|nr:AAA-domain-containing protein [Coccomyxa subellipsoidea C-169]EIE22784.1 AAA-domain-containing protein [Coccomyxa subellipsoidea C-169]|eukprot:XP_005647328.1 AAA-domain-containing protein [Coccomyxa subellipsoidea C-169]